MTTMKKANRFGFTMSLPVDEEHTYTVKSPPIDVGTYLVELSGIMQQASAYFEKDETPPDILAERLAAIEMPPAMEDNEFRAMLGDAYDQMVSDGMPFEVLKLAAATVGVWVRSDRETAEEFWNNGGREPRPTRRPQDRKTKSSSPRT